MKIVMTSERLPPSRGGLSTVAAILDAGLTARGHELVIVTGERSREAYGTIARIMKLNSPRQWWRYFRLLVEADVVLQNNVSSKTLILPLLLRKPTVVALHIWLETPQGQITWRERLKILLLRRSTRIVTPNLEITDRFGGEGQYVTNGYDEATFSRQREWCDREYAFVVVARLIEDKGVRQLLEAFALVSPIRSDYVLNVIGTGPEEANLKKLAADLNISSKVRFLGALDPRSVAEVLNNSRVMCVPSMWDEVFGIVALEGMGCGLPVIATNVSGLTDAHHGYGLLVEPNEEVIMNFAEAMEEITSAPDKPLDYLKGVEAYLQTRNRKSMVDAYETVMREIC